MKNINRYKTKFVQIILYGFTNIGLYAFKSDNNKLLILWHILLLWLYYILYTMYIIIRLNSKYIDTVPNLNLAAGAK